MLTLSGSARRTAEGGGGTRHPPARAYLENVRAFQEEQRVKEMLRSTSVIEGGGRREGVDLTLKRRGVAGT